MTATTTIPRIPTVRTGRVVLWVAVSFAVGGALGSGLTAAATDDSSGVRSAPAVASTPAASTASDLPMSADAAERWLDSEPAGSGPAVSADAAERQALAEQEARRDLCATSSADAAERCMASR